MKLFFTSIFGLLFAFCGFTQNNSVLDSLNLAYEKTEHDTDRIKTLIEINNIYYDSDPAKMIVSYSKAMNMIDSLLKEGKTNYKTFLLNAKCIFLNNISEFYLQSGQRDNSLLALNHSVQICQELNDSIGISKTMNNMALLYGRNGDMNEALKYLKKSYAYGKANPNQEDQIHLLGNIAYVTSALNNPNEALSYYYKAINLNDSLFPKSQERLATIYNNMGILHSSLNNLDEALKYYEKALDLYKQNNLTIKENVVTLNIGVIHYKNKAYIQAKTYYEKSLELSEKLVDRHRIANAHRELGNVFLKLKHYNQAKYHYQKSYAYTSTQKDLVSLSRIQTCLGTLWLNMENFDKAFVFSKAAVESSNKLESLQIKRDAYDLHSRILAKKESYKEAFEMHVLYKQMADSINNEENQKAVVKKQMQYEFEKKEAIAQAEQEKKDAIQQQELEKRDAQVKMYASMSGVLVLIFIGAFLYFRNRKKTEKLALEKKLVELEQKALSLQMNPHFIFNALNSISGFISENDPVSAKKYLAKFAKLMRLILEGSTQQSESIKHEADLLENYLQLEQLRFNNKFEFNIEIDEQLDPETASIPPMLLQPQVENALLHGIMHKEQGGKIDVRFLSKGNKLVCEIEDNGIGREKSKSINPNPKGHKSMATSITQERIEIMNAKEEQHINYLIEDLLDETNQPKGTKVVMEFGNNSLNNA